MDMPEHQQQQASRLVDFSGFRRRGFSVRINRSVLMAPCLGESKRRHGQYSRRPCGSPQHPQRTAVLHGGTSSDSPTSAGNFRCFWLYGFEKRFE
jgi:hypothetical protein